MKLYLYHTSGCHLCEIADQILSQMRLPEMISLIHSDIAESDQLMKLYDVRIPVIKLEYANNDLGWPFSAEDVSQYLAENNINQ